MQYRDATPDDWPAIAQLHTESWQRNYRHSFPAHYLEVEALDDRRKVWEKRFTSPSPHQYVILAEENGMLQGFTCLYLEEHQKWGAFLDNIHVDHRFSGQGIGQALMQKAAQVIKDHSSKSKMYLWVLEKNIAAKRFYKRLGGYSFELSVLDTPGNGKANAFRMVWDDSSKILKV